MRLPAPPYQEQSAPGPSLATRLAMLPPFLRPARAAGLSCLLPCRLLFAV